MDDHTGLSHDLPEYVSNVPPPRQAEPRRSYTALCVGGPVDGAWKTVDSRRFEVLEPVTLAFSSTDTLAIDEPFKRHTYHVENFVMFGFATWIAVCEWQFRSSAERHKAIMRALLQRDVAAQMGVL